MKRIQTALLLVLLSGCGTTSSEYLPYHSIARNPRETTSLTTTLDLIPGGPHAAFDEFAVIAAMDDSAGTAPFYYLIVAPVMHLRHRAGLDAVAVSQAVSILPGEAAVVIQHMDDMMAKWNAPAQSSAISYEFATHTKTYLPDGTILLHSVAITFSQTAEGPIMTVQIGTPESEFAYFYEFRNKIDVLALKMQFESALKQLHSKGMP